MKPEIVVKHRHTLAEGPVWHSEERKLYWTDIDEGRVHRFDPATGEREQCYEGSKVGGMTLQADGSLLLFRERGNIAVLRDGVVTSLIAEIDSEQNTRFNDVIADPKGRVLCGLMATLDRRGNLYRLDVDGTLTLMQSGIGCSNGLGFADNGSKLYYTDSVEREIYVFDYDVETGAMTNRRVFWKSDTLMPDGLTVDAEGCVWTAQWEGGCIVRLRPDGTEERRVEVPSAWKVTSCLFGGDDFRDLYITTASIGEPEDSNAGSIFAMRPGVAGVPEHRSRVRVA